MLTEKNKGIFYIILAALCFSIMSLFVRLSGDIPSMQKSFFRNAVALVFSLVILWKNKISILPNKGNLPFLFLRAAFGTLGLFCNFYAISHLPLSDANMLNKLSPFFAIIFSFFLLKEKVAPYQIICVITAFIGTLFILRPGMDDMVTFPALIGLLGGLGAGIAYTMVRILSSRKERGPYIVFFFSAFSCLASIPFFIFSFAPMNGKQVLFLLLAGLAASGGQFSITAAYSHAPAKEISVYDYTQILFSSLWGILFLGEFPTWASLLGYVIICGASVTMFLIRRRKDTVTQ